MNGFILVTLLILLSACSGKMEDPVSTKVTVAGLAVAGQNGGILLAGTNLDESHTFIQDISEDPSIVLEKGTWKFVGIAWDGASGKMTGTNRCAVVNQVEIQPPSASIALNFTTTNCNSSGQELIVQELLGNAYQSPGGNQFKTLTVNLCEHVDSGATGCLAGGTLANIQTGSFELGLKTEMTTNFQTQITGGIKSQCFSVTNAANYKYAQTSLKIPSGSGLTELIHRPVIRLHDSTNCSDANPIIYNLGKGLLEHDDQYNGGTSLLSDLDVNNGSSELQLYLEHNQYTVNGNPIGSAHSLHWAETSPFNSSTVNATWTRSSDPAVVSETAELFTTNDCSGASVQASPNITSSNSTETYAFTSLTDGDYYFRVFSLDSASNPIAQSDCSPLMTVDTTPPSTPNSLGYAYPNIQWAPSPETDVNKQEVTVYTDAGCTSSVSAPQYFYDNTTGSMDTSGLGLAATTTYYFNVVSFDIALNQMMSNCQAFTTP